MRPVRLWYATAAVLLASLACGPLGGGERPAPTAVPSPSAAGARCGDGLCSGSETAENCPADCAASPTPALPTVTLAPPSFQLQHVRTVTITTDAEGGGARPELVYANDRFFVIYLGNIRIGSGERAFKLKVFDRDFSTEIAARDLVTASPEYGGPTDIRVTSDGEFLYAFYEMASPQAGAHLLAAKYALTDDFPRLAYTAEPIATGPYWHDARPGDETLDDPAPVLGPDSVTSTTLSTSFVMTKVRTGITPDSDTIYRLRELTTDLVPVGTARDLDLSQAVDGGANVNSLLYVDGNFYTVLYTTVAPMCGRGGGPDVANYDLMMIRFDGSWTYDPATDVWALSKCSEVERYISGFGYRDGAFYVAYHSTPRTWTCQPGGPPPGPGPGEVVWLKVFDADLNPVDAVVVSGDAFGGHPTVEVVGDLVYVAYERKEAGEERGNVVVAIYQKVPREADYKPTLCGEPSG